MPPRPQREGGTAWSTQPSRDDRDDGLIDYARRLLAARRSRERLLEGLTLGEPEWDILLDAFVATGHGSPLPVSSLCVTANVSVSTALRHINAMISGGYIRRYRDLVDQRRSLVEMTPWGEARVRLCLFRMRLGLDSPAVGQVA